MRPKAPKDPERKVAEVQSRSIAYTDTGAGRVVVGVHGIPASSRDYRWLDAAFDDRVRFLRPDLPGFGASPALPTKQPTFGELGESVAAFCEALDLCDVLVVGHSMGGAIALEAALRTERITALALVNSSGPIQHRGNFPRTYRSLLQVADLGPLARRIVLGLSIPVAHQMGFSKRITEDEFEWAGRIAVGYEPAVFGEQLRRWDKPVFVAYADRDPSVEPAVSRAIIASAFDPVVLAVDARSHNLQSTHATELADALVQWSTEPPP